MVDMGASLKEMKMMKMDQFNKLDEALYIWFRQQRELNFLVTGPVLVEKAKLLFPMLQRSHFQLALASYGDFVRDMA